MKVGLFTDGGARDNPGPSAGAWLIVCEDGTSTDGSAYFEHGTNNRAEYLALLRGLEAAIGFGADEIEAYSDSMLVVKQVAGAWRVKNRDLRAIHEQVTDTITDLVSFAIYHVPRTHPRIQHCDRLCGQVLSARPTRGEIEADKWR